MSKQKRIVRIAEIANPDPKPTKPRTHTVPLIDSLSSDVETDFEPPTPTVLLSASPSSAPSFLHRPFFQPPTPVTTTTHTSHFAPSPSLSPVAASSSSSSTTFTSSSLATVSFPSLPPSTAWPAAVVSPIVTTPSPKLSSLPSSTSAPATTTAFSAVSTLTTSTSSPSLSSLSSSTAATTTALTQSESFSNGSSSSSSSATSSSSSSATLSGDLSRLVSAITSVKISDKFSSLMPKEDQEARAHLTARVSQFYALHCPDQQANANKVAENHFNDVKLLNKKLRAKYGVDLTSLDEPSLATAAVTAAATTTTTATATTTIAPTTATASNGNVLVTVSTDSVVIHAPDSDGVVNHVSLRASDKTHSSSSSSSNSVIEKSADPVDAISERLLAAENELTEAKEQLEARICAVERLKVQLDEERDLRRRLEQQVEAIKSLFEQEASRSQQQAAMIIDLQTNNDKLRAFQKELEQECQVSLRVAAEGKARSARELSEVQTQKDALASQFYTFKNCPIPCDAGIVVAVEQHKRLAEREIAHLSEEVVMFRETERNRLENYHNADAENSRAELATLQAKLAAAYQILEADQETQYAMGEEVLNIQVKMDKMKGEERERVLDTILALSQMKESIDEQVRVKNAEVQSLREQVRELETVCRQITREEEEEKARREKGLQTLQRTLDARIHEQAQWGKLITNGVIINAESESYIMSILLHLIQSSSTFLTCLQDRRELNNDQEEKAHQQEENRTKQIQSELGELREMLSDAQTGKQRLAAQSSDTIDELRELVAGMQQELAANQQKKKKLLVLPNPQNFYLTRKM